MHFAAMVTVARAAWLLKGSRQLVGGVKFGLDSAAIHSAALNVTRLFVAAGAQMTGHL